MQNIVTYNLNEIVALIISVLIGTGAYLGFIMIRKNQDISIKLILGILAINLFITYIFSGVLRIFKWGEYRIVILPLVAYGGQYLADWFDKRYPNIFDAGFKKASGIDLDPKETEEPIIKIEENEETN